MKSLFSFLLISCCLVFSAQNALAQSNTAKKTVIPVFNLTCDGDMPTIKKQLLNQDGVESVTFTKRVSNASDFTIAYNDEVISPDQLRKVIEATPGCDDKSTTPYRVKKEKTVKTKKQ